MLFDDLRARLEKFFRNGRYLFDSQFLSEARIAAAIGEEYCDFGEAARLPVQLSPVAEIRIRKAAPHAAEPPEPPCGAGEWHTVRQAPGRQRRSVSVQ
jgi:hypothetical protein